MNLLTSTILASTRQLSKSEEMSAEEATNTADDGLKYLHLAIDIEASRPEALSSCAITSIAVLFHQSRDSLLEVSRSGSLALER